MSESDVCARLRDIPIGGSRVRLDDYVPICGKDFCEDCGDCLHCYSGDVCVHSSDGKHTWPIRFEGEREKVEG